ncbi:MAG: response regulator [Ignavibacteriales bacterium]|nr:response regulator [Ignavibacteriales bacterium]
MGLTIAKKYTELMGGKISVTGALGEGTEFTVEFPLTHTSCCAKKQNEKTAPHQVLPGKPAVTLHKVLYVEDDSIAVTFVSTLLKGFYLLDIAVSAEEALLKVREKQYDIILMDINLKHGMNGLQATQIIRTIPGYKNTPIIACTAYAMENEKEDFLTHGLSHHLSKPFTRQELFSELSMVMQLQRKQAN